MPSDKTEVGTEVGKKEIFDEAMDGWFNDISDVRAADSGGR
jgi:hypothetical protein